AQLEEIAVDDPAAGRARGVIRQALGPEVLFAKVLDDVLFEFVAEFLELLARVLLQLEQPWPARQRAGVLLHLGGAEVEVGDVDHRGRARRELAVLLVAHFRAAARKRKKGKDDSE